MACVVDKSTGNHGFFARIHIHAKAAANDTFPVNLRLLFSSEAVSIPEQLGLVAASAKAHSSPECIVRARPRLAGQGAISITPLNACQLAEAVIFVASELTISSAFSTTQELAGIVNEAFGFSLRKPIAFEVFSPLKAWLRKQVSGFIQFNRRRRIASSNAYQAMRSVVVEAGGAAGAISDGEDIAFMAALIASMPDDVCAIGCAAVGDAAKKPAFFVELAYIEGAIGEAAFENATHFHGGAVARAGWVSNNHTPVCKFLSQTLKLPEEYGARRRCS